MDPLVDLARRAVAHAVMTGRSLPAVPGDLANRIPAGPAACFVSLHGPRGELRGCIGTLRPVQPSLGEEVLENARSAALRDRRFPPVAEGDLAGLDISVDVLSEPEEVGGAEALDPRRYGVLVSTADGRRGVLLPDLEGVETVEAQLSIACRKAGIRFPQEPIRIQRFTVVRHRQADT